MARLIQQNSVTSQKSAVSMPAATQTVAQAAGTVVAPAKKKASRRYPRWFVSVRLLAVLLTLWQLGHWLLGYWQEYAASHGWTTLVKYARMSIPDGASLAVAPQGDKYLIGYQNGDASYLKVYKPSGELLWNRAQLVDNPIFSQDGTQIFSGAEALETATGNVIARIPVQKDGLLITWGAQGSHAAWKSEKGIHVWERATNKIRAVSLNKRYSASRILSLSPDGKWLAAAVYSPQDWQKGNVAVWNLAKSSEPELYPVGSNAGEKFEIVFSPDSRKLLYTGKDFTYPGAPNKLVAVWTLNNRSDFRFSSEHFTQEAVWSPDGKNIALRGENMWSVHDALSGKRLWNQSHSTNRFLKGMSLTQDNKLYYYDYTQYGWAQEYWDLSSVLNKTAGN